VAVSQPASGSKLQWATDDGAAGAGINNLTTGSNQFFNRRSTVSLSGAFGVVRLGRDYVPSFWNDTVFDPFGTNGYKLQRRDHQRFHRHRQLHSRQQLDRLIPAAEPGWLLRSGDVRHEREDYPAQKVATIRAA
jgi:hypothetical protein